MEEIRITQARLRAFKESLTAREHAKATVEKYLREGKALAAYLQSRPISKTLLLKYRDHIHTRFLPQTVNGKLIAVNALLDFCGASHLRLKLLRVQRTVFRRESRELTEPEYRRLLSAAQSQGNDRLYHVMLTITGTGIRVSELAFITVEAVRVGKAHISMKGKERVVILTRQLCSRLLAYALKHGVTEGVIFRTRSGKPLDRSNICHDMKKLCKLARVEAGKVFPHNFRHLFARSFYAVEKDLSHLADILGHSSIETTRIYVATSVREHEKVLNRMRLII